MKKNQAEPVNLGTQVNDGPNWKDLADQCAKWARNQ